MNIVDALEAIRDRLFESRAEQERLRHLADIGDESARNELIRQQRRRQDPLRDVDADWLTRTMSGIEEGDPAAMSELWRAQTKGLPVDIENLFRGFMVTFASEHSDLPGAWHSFGRMGVRSDVVTTLVQVNKQAGALEFENVIGIADPPHNRERTRARRVVRPSDDLGAALRAVVPTLADLPMKLVVRRGHYSEEKGRAFRTIPALMKHIIAFCKRNDMALTTDEMYSGDEWEAVLVPVRPNQQSRSLGPYPRSRRMTKRELKKWEPFVISKQFGDAGGDIYDDEHREIERFVHRAWARRT